MTKSDIVDRLTRQSGLKKKEVLYIVDNFIEKIKECALKGDKIEIRGSGSFHTRQRRVHIARNPRTGARVEVPPKRIPFFKPSKELRELVDSLNANT